MSKTYPFSVRKHAHDIELYHNRLYNTMCDMQSGEIPMDAARYDKIHDMFYGPLMELYEMMFTSRDGVVVYLTGPQISLAKKIVFWAANYREDRMEERKVEKQEEARKTEEEAQLREYYKKHIKGRRFEDVDPARWEWYSDWHKDLYGYRP